MANSSAAFSKLLRYKARTLTGLIVAIDSELAIPPTTRIKMLVEYALDELLKERELTSMYAFFDGEAEENFKLLSGQERLQLKRELKCYGLTMIKSGSRHFVFPIRLKKTIMSRFIE